MWLSLSGPQFSYLPSGYRSKSQTKSAHKSRTMPAHSRNLVNVCSLPFCYFLIKLLPCPKGGRPGSGNSLCWESFHCLKLGKLRKKKSTFLIFLNILHPLPLCCFFSHQRINSRCGWGRAGAQEVPAAPRGVRSSLGISRAGLAAPSGLPSGQGASPEPCPQGARESEERTKQSGSPSEHAGG